jgi:aminoglycoside 3-N-acetyltransferase
MSEQQVLYTQRQLADALRELGVEAGQTVMLHASVKAVGRVMGGPNAIIQAVLDALTPDGTLMMYVGWNDIPDFVGELPPDERQRYYDEHPPFDPATARAVRDHSILAEFFRTWPGIRRSLNAEASMAALGAQADWITRDHPSDYGYGAESPLAKLVEAGGKVLMLGAPLDTITLLHYAENRAKLRHKGIVRYQYPVLRDGQKVWIDVEDFYTGDPHDDYSFEQIAQEYLAAGKGRHGKVGDADTYLFDAADLVRYAIAWLEERFGA